MNKYRNQKCSISIDNEPYKFDSILEKDRFLILWARLKNKEISDLVLQPEYTLINGFKLGKRTLREIKYIADFRYKEDDFTIVEDTKGAIVKEYAIKKKLFLEKISKNKQSKIIFREVFKDKIIEYKHE